VGGKKRAIERGPMERTGGKELISSGRERRGALIRNAVECKGQAENGKTVQGSSVSTC